jgi:hypothetical protein
MGLTDDFNNFNTALNATVEITGKVVPRLTDLAIAHGLLSGKVIANSTAMKDQNNAIQGTGDAAKVTATNVGLLTDKVDADSAAVKANIAQQAALQAALDKTSSSAKQAAAQHTSVGDAMNSSASSAGAYGGRVDDLARGFGNLTMNQQLNIDAQNGVASSIADGIAVGGQGAVMNLTLSKATDAETASLKALLETQNAYNTAAANALTVAQGWNDYLAELKASFDSGAMSVMAYKQALEDFETQLSTEFPGAVGNAKAALTSMMGVLNTLIATAGAGAAGAGDVGQAGNQSISKQLNNAFNNP